MKFRTVIFTITLLLLQNLSFAQEKIVDQQASELLNKISSIIKNYKNIEIDFTYNLENQKEHISEKTHGTVILKDDKYRLNLMGMEQLFDGEKIYMISSEDEEINISKAQEEENIITPSKIFTFFEKGFEYQMDIIQSIKGRDIQYIKLTPENKNENLKQILLGVDLQTQHIYKVIQQEKNGSNTTITINNFKTDIPLSETLFTFDANKYTDFFINDL